MNRLKNLGPGLLYAGAAIGVSHLVQSTRAGAMFGFTLIWAILLAHLIKYPFFEFGSRYVAATGKSILHGYQKLGKWALILFGLLTLSTMFTIEAAILAVTSGLAENLFELGVSVLEWSAIILMFCTALLLTGRFSLLDNLIKIIILILSITTIAAFATSVTGAFNQTNYFGAFSWSDSANVFFLIALMGWMPAPLDISVWQSVWTVANNRKTKKKANLKETLFDFKIGFFGTLTLAIMFLSLGAFVLSNQGVELSTSAVGFSKQLISVYTNSLGSWSFYIISIAALTTMFSTAITCLDAFPRVLRPTFKMLFTKFDNKRFNKKIYTSILIATSAGSFLVIMFFMKNMKDMVDLATTLSFLTTPILAWLNYQVIFKTDLQEEYLPSTKMKKLAQVGLVFLTGFALFYVYYRFLS